VVLCTDVLGIESLVDMLEHDRFARIGQQATESAILGPFYQEGLQPQPIGTSIIRQKESGAPFVYLHGIVSGSDGKPLKGAIVDIWHDVCVHLRLFTYFIFIDSLTPCLNCIDA
jgi:catechol 1,2-dioxygenase